ncbi:MAG: S1/P1 nuclease [Nitrospira sp.]
MSIIVILTITPVPGLPWGQDGHRIVGALADRELVGSRAEREVRTLLQPKETLENISFWADCAKGYCGELTEEMKAFVQSNPTHHHYHYTDVPFQRSQYIWKSIGTSDDDIVVLLTQAIRVLQGKGGSSDNPHYFTRRQALLLLAHCVGDVHQPLHVGSAYLDRDDIFIDPARMEDIQAGSVEATFGGNRLLIDGGRSLHADWDSTVVRYAMNRAHSDSVLSYVDALMTKYPAHEAMTGEPTTWPQLWVEDSLQLAKRVHEGLIVQHRRRITDPKHGDQWVWAVTPPPDYDRQSSTAAEQALVRAGKRLAALLRAIWPE